MSTNAEVFAHAVKLQQAGRVAETEQLLRQILASDPQHADSLHLLGVIHFQRGEFDEAAKRMVQAISLRPQFPSALSNLGLVFHSLRQFENAVAALRQAIAQKPTFTSAHFNLGNSLRALGKLNEAQQAYEQALALQPNLRDAALNLAAVFQEQGKFAEAIATYRQVIQHHPQDHEIFWLLGRLLRDLGEDEEGIALLRRAVALNPQFSSAYVSLGNALLKQGKFAEARDNYQHALDLKPEYPLALSNLGHVLVKLGDPHQAVVYCRRAIARDPLLAEAYNNLGIALNTLQRGAEAIEHFRRAIVLRRELKEAYVNLADALCLGGRPDEALDVCQRLLVIAPDYPDAHNISAFAYRYKGQMSEAVQCCRQAVALSQHNPAFHSNLLFSMMYCPEITPDEIAAEHREFERIYGEPLRKEIPHHPNSRDPQRRLRVGYVSPDLFDHPVGRFMLPLLEEHDHREFEFFGYASVANPDSMTEKCRGALDHWRDVRLLTDEQVATLVQEDQIDILVDLSMHTAKNRLLLFARKPAPVQVTYLGTAGTTGLQAIDYRLSDRYLDPPEFDFSRYSETTIFLPENTAVYRPAAQTSPVSFAPVLRNQHVTFGCLNNVCKVSAVSLNLWAKLLHEVPTAALLLLAVPGEHRTRVTSRFQELGINSSRLKFVSRASMPEYFRNYSHIDIALDPLPYGGGTTTCDALWMGVPVISLMGATAVGRAGLSILANIGLPELVASNEDEYIRLAAELANDLPRLLDLRATLRQRMSASPMMNAARFARHVEQAYREMWQRYCAAK